MSSFGLSNRSKQWFYTKNEKPLYTFFTALLHSETLDISILYSLVQPLGISRHLNNVEVFNRYCKIQERRPLKTDLLRSKAAIDLQVREFKYVLEHYIHVKFEG